MAGFSAEERAAMKAHAKELKLQEQGAEGLRMLLDAIAEMPDAERAIAERVHAIVSEVAPSLLPRTFYGFPGWAKNGKVLVFFQPATKFKTRYCTLGFQDGAALDDGILWPVSFAITGTDAATERRIAELVARAVGADPE